GGARRLGENLLAEFLGEALVPVLDLGELEQQLADRGIARRARRLPIKARGLELHGLGVFAYVIEPQRPGPPERLLRNESLDVLAADERQVLAELRAVKLEQHGAMAHLLVRHLVEHLCRGREVLAQSLRKAAIDAAVLLLIGDGERENLLLGQI